MSWHALAARTQAIWQHCSSMPPQERHLYEIIREQQVRASCETLLDALPLAPARVRSPVARPAH